MDEAEQWLPVVGFEGLYEVSDLGRVRRVAPAQSTRVGKVLACPRIKGKPYKHVALRRDNANHHRKVHHLVLEAFVGPCPPGLECRHLDGDGGNNRRDNLAWGTKVENQADRARHGTRYRGEQLPGARLTEGQVREIRASAESHGALARRLGISKSTVCDVRKGRSWAHVR